MKFTDYLKQGITGISAATSSFLCFVAMVDSEPELAVLSGMWSVASVYGLRYFRTQYTKQQNILTERKLLELFAYKYKAVSVAQIVLTTSMSVDEIQEHMDSLQRKGIVETVVTDAGAILYQLPENQLVLSNSSGF